LSHRRHFSTVVKSTAVLISAAFFSVLTFLPSAASATAGINNSLNYQGRLLTSSGAIAPDGFYNMEFKIYQDGTGCVTSGTSPCGGTLKYTEDWVYGTGSPDNRVKVTNGYFSVQIGTINTTLASAVDWNQNTLWMSVNIGNTSTAANFGAASGDGEMLPFKRLTAAPYALNSGTSNNALLLQGVAANKFARLDTDNTPAGTGAFLGYQLFKPTTDSTTAFQIQPSGSSTPVLNVDTTNSHVSIGTSTASAYPLNVVGEINSTTGLDVAGTQVCTSTGCSTRAADFGNLTSSTTGLSFTGTTTGAVRGPGVAINIQNATTGQNGLLTSTDWNTFNNKQSTLTLGNLTSSTGGITITGGTGAVVGSGATVNIATASASLIGLLSSADWSTFNGKENGLTFTGNGLFSRSGNTITGITCTNGQSLVFNAGTWGCGSGSSGGSGFAAQNSNVVDNNVGYNTSTLPGSPTSTLTAGTTSQLSVTADFNGDGKPDLAVTNGGSTGVAGLSVYLNTGTGLPTTATQTIPTGSAPRGIAAADFDGDGKIDLILVNQSNNTAFVYNNQGIAGAPFPNGQSYSLTTSSSPGFVAVGDFNGDGRPDVVISNQGGNTSNSAYVYINSAGTLPSTRTAILTGIGTPIGESVGDFNGDGKADIAIVDNAAVIKVYNNTGTALSTTPTSSLTTANLSPEYTTLGDFNGDGKIDLAVVYNSGTSGTSGVGIFLNTGTGLSTTASSTLNLGTSSSAPYVPVAADFNGDGKTDLAVGAQGVSSVYINSGSALPTSASYTLSGSFSGGYGTSAADFNSDGKMDLAVVVAQHVDLFTNLATTPAPTAYSSVKVGSDGLSRIAYYDTINKDLKFAQCTNTTCTGKVTTSIDTAGDVGQFVSLALNSSNIASISYYDNTNGDLKYVLCGNLACSSSTPTSIDTTGNVGQYTSIALNGSTGVPSIAYYDVTNAHLKYVLCGNTACTGSTPTTLDPTNLVGQYASIALNSSNIPSISYYAASGGHLMYVLCGNTACSSGNTFNAVDEVNNVGTYSSLALSSSGIPSVSYYDANTGDLKYALCGNTACSSGNTTTVVDSTGNVGQYSSIAMGTDGFARISYYDATNGNGDLKYAVCTNAGCTLSNILFADYTASNAGQFTSIAVGTDGFARVAYYDATSGYLKLWLESNTTAGGQVSALSSVTAAIIGNTIDNLNFAQSWSWSTANTQTAFAMSANALTSGTALAVSSSSTGLTGSVVSISATGTGNTGSALALSNSSVAAGSFALNVTSGGIQLCQSSGNCLSMAANGNGEPVLSGTARHAKTLALTVEYPGAVLDASGTNNTGTLTAPYDPAQREGYYKWTTSTATPAQTYDVVLTVQVPSDWAAWNTTTPVTIDDYTTDLTNGTILAALTDTAGTLETAWNTAGAPTCSLTPASASTWTVKTGCNVAGTYTAGGFMNLRVRMSAMNNSVSRIGTVKLNYLSKY
jgi:hypothetical protein